MSRPELTVRPHYCSVTEIVLIAIIAFGSGGGFGAVFADVVFPHPLPWFNVVEAVPTDGDTVRTCVLTHIDDITAPPLDRHSCPQETELAHRAHERTKTLFSAGNIRVHFLGEDEYGRLRAQYVAGDRPIGAVLLREGLAQKTNPAGARWCPQDRTGTDTNPSPIDRALALWP